LAALSAFVVWLMGARVSVWLGVPALAPYLWLLPVGLLGVGCYQALSYWAIRRQAFRRLARTRITQGVAQVAIQLAWGLAAGGPAGLLAGSVAGQAAGVTTLASDLRHDRTAFRSLNLRTLRWVMRRYRRFPLLATAAALLNASARQLPALLLATMYGTQVAGLYALGQRVIRMPMQVVGSAVAQVYTGEAARLARQNRSGLRRLVLRLTARMLLIGGLPLGLIALGGPRLFEVGFGPDWGEAGYYVQILALAYLGQFVVAPIAQTLQILERQDIHLIWNGAQVAVMVLIFFFGYWLAWTPFTLLAAYSLGMTLSYCSVFLVVWMETSRSRRGPVAAQATGSQADAAP
jgi:O-antigen/teichoic acid export membrane protein